MELMHTFQAIDITFDCDNIEKACASKNLATYHNPVNITTQHEYELEIRFFLEKDDSDKDVLVGNFFKSSADKLVDYPPMILLAVSIDNPASDKFIFYLRLASFVQALVCGRWFTSRLSKIPAEHITTEQSHISYILYLALLYNQPFIFYLSRTAVTLELVDNCILVLFFSSIYLCWLELLNKF